MLREEPLSMFGFNRRVAYAQMTGAPHQKLVDHIACERTVPHYTHISVSTA
jgi:hypothetical protein